MTAPSVTGTTLDRAPPRRPGARRAPAAHHRRRPQARDAVTRRRAPRDDAPHAIAASSTPSASPSTRPIRTARSRSSTPPRPISGAARPAVGEEWCGSLRLLFLDESRCATTSVRWRSPSRRRDRSAAARPSRSGPDGSNVSFMAYPTPLFDDDGAAHRRRQRPRRHHRAPPRRTGRPRGGRRARGVERGQGRVPRAGLARAADAGHDDLRERPAAPDPRRRARPRRPRVDDRRHRDRRRSPPLDHREPAAPDPARVGERGRTSSRRSSTGSSSTRSPRSRRATRIGRSRSPAIGRGRSSRATRPTSRCCSRTSSAMPPSTARPARPIEVEISTAGDEVVVEVLDRGLGLDDVDAERLFEPFFRAEPARSAANGLGIGLALCQRIVAALGGRVWARPRDGGAPRSGSPCRSPRTGRCRRDRTARVRLACGGPADPTRLIDQSPAGQTGGLGGWLGSASQSPRVGEKISMTTAPRVRR